MSSVRVVLDLSPESHPQDFRSATFEQCIRVAASLCDSLHRQHCRIELLAGQDLYIIGASAGGLQRAMDALAILEVASPTGRARSLHRRSMNGQKDFAITVTTDSGFQFDRPHQIVVTRGSGKVENGYPVSAAWISIEARESLAHLTAIWRKQLS